MKVTMSLVSRRNRKRNIYEIIFTESERMVMFTTKASACGDKGDMELICENNGNEDDCNESVNM